MNEDNIDVLSEKEQRYDEMLLNILQNEGKIQPFIDTVFRFLYRRFNLIFNYSFDRIDFFNFFNLLGSTFSYQN
jgi:hypothetical protein